MENQYYFKEMSPEYVRKEPCHFCRRTMGINHWAFVTSDQTQGLTKAVPCCDRCIRRIRDKVHSFTAKKILSELSGLPMSSPTREMTKTIIFSKNTSDEKAKENAIKLLDNLIILRKD